MPELLASELTREHGLELLRIEDDELRRLRRTYEQARKEILARLADTRAEKFTAQQLRSVQAQIDAGLQSMVKKLEGDAAAQATALLQQGIDQTLAEIAYWEPRFRGGATQRIRAAAARRVLKPQALLLHQHQVSIRAYGLNLIGETQRRLGVHLVKNSSWREMSLDIAGRLDANAIQGARWRAERIVRTEMVDALSLGHYTALEETESLLPGLAAQWDATLDERSSHICRDILNRRIRRIGEPFGTYRGRPIIRPPAIPNCRSRIIPWHQDWADLDETIEPSKAPKPVTRTHEPGPKPVTKTEAKGQLWKAQDAVVKAVGMGVAPTTAETEALSTAARALFSMEGLSGKSLDAAVAKRLAAALKAGQKKLGPVRVKAAKELQAVEKKWIDAYIEHGGQTGFISTRLEDDLYNAAANLGKLEGAVPEEYASARLAVVAKQAEEAHKAQLVVVEAKATEAKAAFVEGWKVPGAPDAKDLEGTLAQWAKLQGKKGTDANLWIKTELDAAKKAGAQARHEAVQVLEAQLAEARSAYQQVIEGSLDWNDEIGAARTALQQKLKAVADLAGDVEGDVNAWIAGEVKATENLGKNAVGARAKIIGEEYVKSVVSADGTAGTWGAKYVESRAWYGKLIGEKDPVEAAVKALEDLDKQASAQIKKAAIHAEAETLKSPLKTLVGAEGNTSELVKAAEQLSKAEHFDDTMKLLGVEDPGVIKAQIDNVLKDWVDQVQGAMVDSLVAHDMNADVAKMLWETLNDSFQALAYDIKKQSALWDATFAKAEAQLTMKVSQQQLTDFAATVKWFDDAAAGSLEESGYAKLLLQQPDDVIAAHFKSWSAEQIQDWKLGLTQIVKEGAGGPKAPPALKPYPKTQSGAPNEITLPSGKAATKYKGSSGSNPGGFYKTPDGEDYFVKFPKSTGQVGAEHVSADLARMMGLKTKDYQAFMPDEAHVAIASPKTTLKDLSGSQMAGWKNREELAEHFVHAAWTRNWDVVGLEFDNLVATPGGNLLVVDYGGSLLWRAQGALKTDGLPKIVAELKSLRGSTNPQAAKAFGSLTDQDIAKAIKAKLADLDEDEIVAAVARGNFDAADAAKIKTGLLERKEWLDDWADDVLGAGAKKGTPDEVKKALLGDLPNDPDVGIAWKPDAPHKTNMAERYTKALQGDTESLVRMGRRLYVGTPDVEQNQDLALRFLQAAWQTDKAAVTAECKAFPGTMAPVLEALEKKGTGQLSIHAVQKEIAKAQKAAKIAAAKAEQEAAQQTAKAAAELAENQKKLTAAKAAYQQELEAWQPKHEAWKKEIEAKVGKRYTSAGAITKAYEKKVKAWQTQLLKRQDEFGELALKARVDYETRVRGQDEWIERAKQFRERAKVDEAEGYAWRARDNLAKAKRIERRLNKELREAARDWAASVEKITKDAGLLPVEPPKPKPPPGMGGVARPAEFHKGRGAVGMAEDPAAGHPSWETRVAEMRRIGQDLGYSSDQINREIDGLHTAIANWKGSARSIRKAQRDKFVGVPRDQIKGDLVNAERFESEMWLRASGHDGDIWRGENFADDSGVPGGRSVQQNMEWLKNHLETNVGSTWTFPYSHGFATNNGFQGHGYGGSMPIQYHIRGRSSARSFARVHGYWTEKELQTRPGATYLIESYQWFDTPNRHGHRVWINLVEVFDDGTTGLD